MPCILVVAVAILSNGAAAAAEPTPFVRLGALAGATAPLVNADLGLQAGVGVKGEWTNLALMLEGHWLPRASAQIVGDVDRSAAWAFPHLAFAVERGGWRATALAGASLGRYSLYFPSPGASTVSNRTVSNSFAHVAGGVGAGYRFVDLSLRYYLPMQSVVEPGTTNTFAFGTLAVLTLSVSYDLGG